MSISMYQSSAPVFIRMLGNLSAVLDKAQALADAAQDSAELHAEVTSGGWPK